MIQEYKSKSNYGIGGGIGLVVIGVIVLVSMANSDQTTAAIGMVVGGLLRLAGMGVFIWGCCMYSKAKGLSAVNGLWGLLGLIGLIVLACKKDRSLEPNAMYVQRGFEVLPPGTPPGQYSQAGNYPQPPGGV